MSSPRRRRGRLLSQGTRPCRLTLPRRPAPAAPGRRSMSGNEPRSRTLLLYAVFVAVLAGLAGPGVAAPVNPTARLRIVETRTLWQSPEGGGAQRARFSPDGRWLAWYVSGGQVGLAALDIPGVITAANAPNGSSITDLVWSRQSQLGVCIRTETDAGVVRQVAILHPPAPRLVLVGDTAGAYNVAWRQDGRAIAFSTKTALFHRDLEGEVTVKLLDEQAGWRPRGAPAYEDLVFVGDRVAARAAGTMHWWLIQPGTPPVALGELRGLCPDPERDRLFAVSWQAGPVHIPRGAGIVSFDLAANPPEPSIIVPFDHSDGKIYWLPDIWDATYPTTLRLSPDGRTLSFCGVKVGELSPNTWREFCIWQVPSDGSQEPVPVEQTGNIFKRFDVGETHFIGWRYRIDSAIVLGDLTRHRAWRLPDEFDVQRANTDVLTDRLLVGAARGNDVVLIQLEEAN